MKMNNLDICKRIAEIEGVNVRMVDGSLLLNQKVSDCDNVITIGAIYNPLTDDALCFRLMVKYNVWRWSNPRDNWYTATIRNSQGFTEGGTINKAICLAIIEAHKDE